MAPRRKREGSSAALEEYERKRDLEVTSEPAPRRRRREKGAPRFVVQEHSARRLHWDLRLEHDGVAASWAIPNGIPEDPKENRKAIHTEDHPLEYLDFEGEIPKGQYGAGTMRIWDSGTYELEKWEEGKVMVAFSGERVRGRYALFRAGKQEKDWMIHRIDPPEGESDPYPESIVPMLAKLGRLPRDEGGWAVELKWDGVRAIAYCRPGRLELQTRNLNTVTSQYPEVNRLSRQLGARDAVLDGELVAFDDEGRPSFERLQQRIHQTSESVIRRRMKTHPVTYVIFDLLYLDGRDLIHEPYSRRRELLEELGLDGDSWQTPSHSVGHAAELLAASEERNLEGLVLKRLDSAYAPGKRNGDWLKVKNLGRQEFVIGGWVPGAGRRSSLGSILIGYYEGEGEERELRYAGKVGTGFTEPDLADLLKRLRPIERDGNPFAGRRGPRAARFVEPVLAAEIEFREMTADGMVRHGSFKGLREDKPAEAVEVEVADLSLSNLDEMLYPKTGFTKGDLIEWYARMSDDLLPHVRGRPLTLKGHRDGVDADHLVVEDLETLVQAVNLGAIELHTSLSLAVEMNRPTSVVFELDPGPPADVIDCAQVAIWIRGMFEQLGLRCYPKTSGSTGMQVYVPLNSEVTYERTRPFARAVAETLERRFSDRVVSRMTKSSRGGRVLVDWSRNDRRRTTVCVYSLRAEERPTVSTPLEWEEVESALAAGDPGRLVFDHAAALARVEERGDLFAPLLSETQVLPE